MTSIYFYAPPLKCNIDQVKTIDENEKRELEKSKKLHLPLSDDGLYDIELLNKRYDCKIIVYSGSCTDKSNPQVFKAISGLLSSSSNYFKHILYSDHFSESENKEIIIENMNERVVSIVLKYLHLGKIELTDENIYEVFSVSDYFDIKSLYKKCLEFYSTHFTIQNISSFLTILHILDPSDLVIYKNKFLSWIDNNQDIILLKNNSKYLSFDLLYNIILKNERVSVCNEEMLIECIINWYKNQKEKKVEELKELLKMIKWDEISKEIYIRYFERNKMLNKTELEKIIKESEYKTRNYTNQCLSNNDQYNDLSGNKINEVEEMILRFPLKEEIYEILLDRMYLYKRLKKIKIIGNISIKEWKLLCERINENHLSLIESIECENVEMNDEYLECILEIKRKEKEEEKEDHLLKILKCVSNNRFSTHKLSEMKENNILIQY